MTGLHKDQGVGEIHLPYNWTYADAAARTGATGFVAADVGKFARQLDDNSIWMLTAVTPTWIQVTQGSTVPAHALGGSSHSADTLANLNSKVSDATLDDSSSTRPPTSHGSAAHSGSIGTHAQLTSVGANDHHNRDHASTHGPAAADPLKLDDLAAPDDNSDLNVSTSAHGLAPKLPNDATQFLNGQGAYTTPAGGTFGSNFQQGNSDGESSTTSGTFQQKLRITTPSLPSGTYRIGFYYEWQKSGLNDFVSRVQVNDTTNIMEGFEEAPDAGSDQWFPRSGFGYYTGSGVLNIDLDYHSGGSDTSFIRRARLEIWRVS